MLLLKNKVTTFWLIFLCLSIAFESYAQELRKNRILWKGKNIEVVKDEISVKIKEGSNPSDFIKKAKLLGLIILDYPDKMGMTRVSVPETKEIINIIDNLNKIEIVEEAEPLIITQTSVTPNDGFYNSQWGLIKINTPATWDINTGNINLVIGVLDSGIPTQDNTLSHPDLSNTNRIIQGNDYPNETDGVIDLNGHGTHVAGIISAESNNTTGITGINWNSKMYISQAFNRDGGGTIWSFYQGVTNAVDNGARVINFSGGAMSSSNTIEQAIVYARDHNCLIVAAAGNYKETNPNKIVEWPAAYSNTYDNVIAVSATNSDDIIADFSSQGPEVTVSAPGVNILSTMPNYTVRLNDPNYGGYSHYYDYMSGTSMAAPIVTGLASLIFSRYPSLTPAQVREIIKQSADDLGTAGFDNLYGYGRINAYKAITSFYVPEVFSTIKAALNMAISGQTIYVTGTQTLTSNIVIPSGVTLTLKSGSTINLNGYAISTINGTINAETGITINGLMAYFKTGSTLKGYSGSVQNAINTASSGQTVELLARTYNDLALTISGKSNFKLIGKGADKTFIDQYEGSISVTSSTEVLLSDMFVYGPISNTNSTHTVTNNLVFGEACGIYDYNGTNTAITGILSTPGGAAFGVSCYGGRGDVYGNNISGYDVAVYIANSNTSYNVGPNNNFCENYQDIAALYGGYAYAISNDYSRPLPATIAGNVSYDHGVNGVCTSLAKTAAQESGIALIEDSGSYYPDSLKAIDEEFNSLLAQNKDNEAGLKDILLPVISKYKKFVSGSNTAKDFSLGLQKTMHAYKTFNGNEEFYSYLTELESAAKYKAYSPVINKFKIWKYADAGDYARAVETADAVLASGIDDTELLAGTLYEKGIIIRDYLADNEGAKLSFEQLIKEYPSSPLKRFAEAQLNTVSASKGKADSAAADIKEIVNVFEAGNYPNPFNPATVIRYSIPEGGNVSLKVYDILGREVAKLVNEFQEAGTHSVEFNGSALSSGIYFYELRSGNNVMIKKMLMMK
ncbi:MAG TPA: S8 family serine peptidase [Ignavibacteriales bacterium]|nr:S8 family serine peptidase [Ignavibacteriales bacterium]